MVNSSLLLSAASGETTSTELEVWDVCQCWNSWRNGLAGLRAKLCRGKNTEHHKAHPNEGRAPEPAFFLSNEFVSEKVRPPSIKECAKKSTISGG
jgi:hypothetical protein